MDHNKKIGIVKVGTIPQVVNVVIERLVYSLQKMNKNHVIGVQTTGLAENQLLLQSFGELEKGTRLRSISFTNWMDHQDYLAEKCDILIVFYNEEDLNGAPLQEQNSTCKMLMVPINLFNEQNQNVYHLGFDSALNEVVSNIKKVEDTAGSLLFPNKRMFLIKIPGKKAGVFLKSAAAALQCEYLEDGSKSELERVTRKLEEKYQDGDSYALLLFNETVSEEELIKHISKEQNVDFRTVMVEEAQCIGGNPTVRDRLFAIQLADKMVQWTMEDLPFNKILIERKDQIKFV